MATRQKEYCESVFPWLKTNLGKCLGGLTGQDTKALKAAVQLVELYCYTDKPEAAAIAFGLAVNAMQRSQHFLAYHAIAHVSDWGFRQKLWHEAQLPGIINLGRCAFEPINRDAVISHPIDGN